jgi:hypothetical protein
MTLTPCAVTTCTQDLLITEPLALCREHALIVSLNVTDILHANARTALTTTEADVERVRRAPDTVWKRPSHTPVVYFLVNGDRVKIGTSTNVTARVGALALRKSNAALLLQGGNDLEDALHQHFASDRIGNTEWFHLSPRIQGYIARRKEADAALRQPRLAKDADNKTVIPAPRATLPVRQPTALEKILETLTAFVSGDQPYMHKDQIGYLAELKGSTLHNALTDLTKEGRIHRGPARGTYGLGPEPTTDSTEE